MDIDDWKKDVERVIADEPIREKVQTYGQAYIDELVEEDVEVVKNTGGSSLNVNKNGITNSIQTKVVDSVLTVYHRWVREKEDIYRKGEVERKKIVVSEERDNIDTEIDKDIAQIKNEYYNDRNYFDLMRVAEDTRKFYEIKKKHNNGKPPVQGKIWLYLVSILSVGFIEWFINYSTFSTKYPPGIAFGATVLIALSIALASHFHGGLLKQRVELFAKDEALNNRLQVILIQMFFSLLLIFALVIVTYNRYDVLVGNMVESGGIALAGVDSETESIKGVLIQFALLNILVWIVGVAVSYFVHDPIPDYQESFKRMKSARKKFYKLDKKLQKELEILEARRKKMLANLDSENLADQKIFDDIKAELRRLINKETSLHEEVHGYLVSITNSHKSKLVDQLKSSINVEDFKVVHPNSKSLSLDDYASAPIELILLQNSEDN